MKTGQQTVQDPTPWLQQLRKLVPHYSAALCALITSLALLISSASTRAQDNKPLTNGDIIKMLENKIPESVILAKIQGSPVKFDTSTDAIIELNKNGVSEKLLAAMLNAGTAPASPAPPPIAAPAPAAAPPPPAAYAPAPAGPGPAPAPPGSAPPGPAPPPGATPGPAPGPPPSDTPVTLDYFHAQLAPFGAWVDVPGYGQCWHPARVIAATPGGDWRPYYDNGHWDYTENGWFWVSDYSWGDIPFHYGRWIRHPDYGWLWAPDLVWGPAWVSWRHAETDGFIGWAPLPYGTVWVDGGWRFHDRAVVEVGFDFGLGEDCYVFVGHDHFHEHYIRFMSRREYPFHVHREMIHGFYGRSVLRNDFHRDEHGRLVNEGLGRKRIEEVTHHEVKVAHFEERSPAVRSEKAAAATHETTAGARGGAAAGKEAAAPKAAEPSKIYRPPAAAASKPAATTPKPAAPSRPASSSKK